MRLGAHVSTAGGIGNAPSNAADIGASCLQLFTRGQRRWVSPPLADSEADRFGAEMDRLDLGPALSHASYLINLAGGDPARTARSADALVDELARAARLAIPFLVIHPGSHLGAGPAAGIARAAAILDRCLEEAVGTDGVTVLLENTAGQGTSIGHRLEHLRDVIGAASYPSRLGVCLDTCHLFAAGHDLRTREAYEGTLALVDGVLGLGAVRAWHLNDSQRPLGSRVDRHADVGEGHLGLDPFRFLVDDPRWTPLPGILETPAGPEGWARQLRTLRASMTEQRPCATT